jgi:hypothetical protein
MNRLLLVVVLSGAIVFLGIVAYSLIIGHDDIRSANSNIIVHDRIATFNVSDSLCSGGEKIEINSESHDEAVISIGESLIRVYNLNLRGDIMGLDLFEKSFSKAS